MNFPICIPQWKLWHWLAFCTVSLTTYSLLTFSIDTSAAPDISDQQHTHISVSYETHIHAHVCTCVDFSLFITKWPKQYGTLSLSHACHSAWWHKQDQCAAQMTLPFCSFLLSISSAFPSSLFWMVPTQLVIHNQKFCKSWKTIVIIHPQGKSESLLLSSNNLLSSVPASCSTKSLLSNMPETSAGPKLSCYSRPYLCI